jgi:hypothetical protein
MIVCQNCGGELVYESCVEKIYRRRIDPETGKLVGRTYYWGPGHVVGDAVCCKCCAEDIADGWTFVADGRGLRVVPR